MSKITVSAYAVMKDCGDGSQSFLLAGTKEEALTCLDRTEEEIENISDMIYDMAIIAIRNND